MARHGRDQNCPSARPSSSSSKPFALSQSSFASPFLHATLQRRPCSAACASSAASIKQNESPKTIAPRCAYSTGNVMATDRRRKLLLEKLRSAIFDPPLDLLSVLAQRTAPHQNAHGSLARSLPPGRTQQKKANCYRRRPEPTSDAFARSRSTPPDPQS